MSLFKVTLAYLAQRRLATALHIVLLALGVATIVLLLLATAQLEDRMQRDARGIDLVVGAKGSPMQIILSSIYHLDVPTGNIPYTVAQELARHRAVKQAIPLALGDSYRGYRIVGTTEDFVAQHGGAIAAGRLWQAPLEAVVGAELADRLQLRVGSTFAGAHGLGDGGAEHETHHYKVVGVLQATGGVLDRLIVTGVESVWAMHADHHDIKDVMNIARHLPDAEKEYTALLIRYSSPLAAAMLPRYVNNNSALQAASPAYETARLFSIIGVGVDVLRGFAIVLMLSAGLTLFVALYGALEDRRYDLAIMRTLGARPRHLLALMLLEAFVLTAAGAILGLLLGHGFTELLASALRQAQQVSISGRVWMWEELGVVAGALAVGIAAAALPAWRAYRTDIAGTLARG